MILETTFELGQKIFRVFRDSEPASIECPACSGKGRLVDNQGESWNCPKCYGFKTINVHKTRDFDYEKLTIGEVRIEKTKKTYKEMYMCKETGIGSGTLHYLDVSDRWPESRNLFATEEEAKEACKRLQENHGQDIE